MNHIRKNEGGMNMQDHKVKVIIGLSFVVIVLMAYITVAAYNNYKISIYNQGIQDGALLQQQNLIRSIQATGYVALNVGVDENGQPVNVILAPVRQQAQGSAQQTTTS